MYNHTTIQGATLNMHGQLYCGHTNATALFSSPVVSALGSESDDLGSSPGLGKVLFIRDVRGKKMRAPLLGFIKCGKNISDTLARTYVPLFCSYHILTSSVIYN